VLGDVKEREEGEREHEDDGGVGLESTGKLSRM
jgi:hypothetical protein